MSGTDLMPPPLWPAPFRSRLRPRVPSEREAS